MDESEAISTLQALGEPTRLRLMLLLANAVSPMAAGAIAVKLNVRQNTLSSHIAALARSDLIHGYRKGRNILYSRNSRTVARLKEYLDRRLCRP